MTSQIGAFSVVKSLSDLWSHGLWSTRLLCLDKIPEWLPYPSPGSQTDASLINSIKMEELGNLTVS